MNYMLTCVPGGENIVKDELIFNFSNIENLKIERGKVYFSSNIETELLFCLRCIDNIYIIIDKFYIGLHKIDLEFFSANITKSNVKKILSTLKKKCNKIIVSASRTGKHTYSRFDLSNIAANTLIKKYGYNLGNEKNHDIAFRIDVNDNMCVFSLQITPSEFRFRGKDYNTSKGGIRPSVAHCLIKLSNPQNDDIFYDPFCGSGTIPSERINYKYKKIFASDISSEVLNITYKNLGNDVIIFQNDACNTKMKDNSIDVVVTNMPWGKQITVENIEELYDNFLKELKRILKTDGKAIILTDKKEIIIQKSSNYLFDINLLAEFSLHGQHPAVYIIRNLEG